MSYIFGFCLVYTEKNYLHITVGENIRQRLKDFFLRKKKIKSFHSGLAILLGFFFFRCSQRGISGSLPLGLKCACSTELWRILVESQKNLSDPPLRLYNILMDPLPSPPPPFHWQLIGSQFSIVPSVIRCWWRLIPHSVPLENYVTSPKNAPLPPSGNA